MRERQFPSFDAPPVIETALGLQFDRISGFTNAHLGAFWRYLCDGKWNHLPNDWQLPEDAHFIEPVFEQLGSTGGWGNFVRGIKLSNDPPLSRIRLRSADNSSMVQLQNGRLHFNWLGIEGQEYPRYAKIRPCFDELMDAFHTFLVQDDIGLNVPTYNQWEVVYVNDISQGGTWECVSDWAGKVVPGLIGVPNIGESIELESVGGTWHFKILPQQGRLHVKLAHIASQDGDSDCLRLNFTARGEASSEDEAKHGLEVGRAVIVETFRNLTASEAHEYWGLQNECGK